MSGWYDRRRMDRIHALIAAQEEAPTPAPEPVPADEGGTEEEVAEP